MMKNLALIVAAGSGVRFGGEVPKQYQLLNGQTVLEHSVQAFLEHPEIDGVRVVIAAKDKSYDELKLLHHKLLKPVHGGAERQDSVRLGLESLIEYEPQNVLIHDAARPFICDEIISEALRQLQAHQAVIPVVEISDSVRYQGEAIDRKQVKLAQTPQGFDFQTILRAHQQYKGDTKLTDDAQLVENMGVKVEMFQGDLKNIKVTTAGDIKRGRLTKVGMGFDVHQFEDGDGVIICGVKIPYDKKLKGHSDADVGLHAIVDALLGAIGEGDIGEHFPPSDERWKNADSMKFLVHTAGLIAEKNGAVGNVDVTIICEEPKLFAYKIAMQNKVAEGLKIPVSLVNVKATTTEKLGFTGRKEGIAAQAIASVVFLE